MAFAQREQSGQLALFEPPLQPEHLTPKRFFLLSEGQQKLERVEGQVASTQSPAALVQHRQQAGQVEVALKTDPLGQARIEKRELLFRDGGQPPIKRGGVSGDARGRLFASYKNTRFAASGAVGQYL